MMHYRRRVGLFWAVVREDQLTAAELATPFFVAQRETHRLATVAAWCAMDCAAAAGKSRDRIDAAGAAAYARICAERVDIEMQAGAINRN